MAKGSRPRRHHTVADAYLRRFAQAGQIVVLRRGGEPITTSTTNAAVQTNFYLYTDDDAPNPLWFEELLAQFEAPALPALSRLGLHFPPSGEDRSAISMYIAFQVLRGPDRRQFQKELHRVSHAENYEFLRPRLESIVARADAGEPLSELREALIELRMYPTEEAVETAREYLNDHESFLKEPDDNEVMRHAMVMAPGLAEQYGQLSWSLLVWDEPVIITSDTPVTFVRVDDPGPDRILFPIDPRHVLQLSASGPEIVLEVDDALRRSVNTLTLTLAFDAIYHHPDNPLADSLKEQFHQTARPDYMSDPHLRRVIEQRRRMRGTTLPSDDELQLAAFLAGVSPATEPDL